MADNPSPDDIKAYDRAIKGLGPEMQKQIDKARALGVSFETLVGFAESFADQLEHAADYLSEQKNDLAKSLKFYQGIEKTFKDTLDSSDKFKENLQNNLKIQRDFGNVLADETQVMDDLLLKRNMIGTGLRDEYAQLLTTYMLENGITDLGDVRVQGLAKELKQRQHIKEELDKKLELTEALAEYTVEVREEVSKLRKDYTLLGAKIKAIALDPQVRNAFLGAFAMEKFKEQVVEVKEVFSDLRKEGLTVSQAFHETGVAMGAVFSGSGASIKENAEIMAGLAESTGNLNSSTSDVVVGVGKLSKSFGVAAGEAGKLYGQMKNLPGATEQSTLQTMKFAGNLAKAAHVAPGAVMKDMAQNSEAIALNTKNGGKDMVAVSVAAHKLGIEMSSIVKMSEGLLDFENSINKQMEASVLLGREINLDKAREAALNGDLLGATQEMLKNIGGEAEFNKMNVVQRKALAESMGVSVADLSKMVKNQDKLASLTKEQQEALATGEKSMDDILANSAGVATNVFNTAVAAGGSLVTFNEIRKAVGDTLSMTKDMVKGYKEGAGVLGKMKGLFGFGAKAPTPPIGPKNLSQGPLPGLGGGPPPTPGPEKAGMLDKLAKIDAKQMLSTAAAIAAVGVALIGVGLGIKFASEGLAELVKSFKGLSGPEMTGAIIAIVAVLLAFTFMVKFLASASLQASLPMLALGAAFLLIGAGIAVAALGIGYMVKQFGEIPYANLMALPQAMVGIGVGLALMASAGLYAMPVIGILLALALVAPRLTGLASALGGITSSSKQENKELGGSSSAVVEALGQVVQAIGTLSNAITKQRGDVIIDKEKVGVVLSPIIERNISLGSTPVRKGGK